MAQLKITLMKSLSGRQERQVRTCRALGLKKIRDFTVQEDTPAVRGMIQKVPHLLKVEEIKGA